MLIFALSCAVGLQTCSWHKISILCIVCGGCLLCTHGEQHFVATGFALQMLAQLCDCSKNVLSEFLMSELGLKLDALTFVHLQSMLLLLLLLLSLLLFLLLLIIVVIVVIIIVVVVVIIVVSCRLPYPSFLFSRCYAAGGLPRR